MIIATVSFNPLWEDKYRNIKLCANFIKKAKLKGCELVIFPEMTLTGFSFNVFETSEFFNDSWTINQFSSLARENSIAINFGMVIKNKNNFFNQSIFISDEGEVLMQYSKIHPFSISGEDKFIDNGNEISFFSYREFNIGLSICYDLRFPELFSPISGDCDLFINIANWPLKRLTQWYSLLQARAIESQLYFIGVNRTGEDNNLIEYSESSKCFRYDGEQLESENFEPMKIFKINKNSLKNYRDKFNTLKDKRFNIYKSFYANKK